MSKENTHKNGIQFLKIFCLGMLLLLSPCSIRTSLQSVLQLEQTEVTSKSKVAQLNNSCQTIEASQFDTSDKNDQFGNFARLLPLKSKFLSLGTGLYLEKSTLFKGQSKYVRPLKIPLYILYKNKKDVILT